MLLTSHAARRIQQRALNTELVELAIEHGTPIHNGGALFYFVGKKDIPANLAPCMKDRIEGLTVLVDSEDSDVITAYRNKTAIRTIRKKQK
jgi:hypothetical protein